MRTDCTGSTSNSEIQLTVVIEDTICGVLRSMRSISIEYRVQIVTATGDAAEESTTVLAAVEVQFTTNLRCRRYRYERNGRQDEASPRKSAP